MVVVFWRVVVVVDVVVVCPGVVCGCDSVKALGFWLLLLRLLRLLLLLLLLLL